MNFISDNILEILAIIGMISAVIILAATGVIGWMWPLIGAGVAIAVSAGFLALVWTGHSR